MVASTIVALTAVGAGRYGKLSLRMESVMAAGALVPMFVGAFLRHRIVTLGSDLLHDLMEFGRMPIRAISVPKKIMNHFV